MTPLAIPTLQRLAELGICLLLAFVGVGLLVAFIIGLLLIWDRIGEEPAAIHEEYRRVEEAGIHMKTGVRDVALVVRASGNDLTRDDPWVGAARTFRPYNWATREPMVWTEPHV